MKINNKDYPFTILVEDKVGKTSGKLYQSISIGHTSVKDKNAIDPKAKYKTDFINFFDEKDLLKLAQLCTLTYNKIKSEREQIKQGEKMAKGMYQKEIEEIPLAEDDIPFD